MADEFIANVKAGRVPGFTLDPNNPNFAYDPLRIDAPPGTMVRFTGRNGGVADVKIVSSILRLDEVYEIAKVRVGDWNTLIELKDVVGQFNSVMFEEMTSDVIRKRLLALTADLPSGWQAVWIDAPDAKGIRYRNGQMIVTDRPTKPAGGPVRMIESPLVIMFRHDTDLICKVHRPHDLKWEAYGLVVADLVRHIALAANIDEAVVWSWVDQERENPTAKPERAS